MALCGAAAGPGVYSRFPPSQRQRRYALAPGAKFDSRVGQMPIAHFHLLVVVDLFVVNAFAGL